MPKRKKYINLFKCVSLIYPVIELSLGEYGNSIDLFIKLVEEQDQNDQYIIGRLFIKWQYLITYN